MSPRATRCPSAGPVPEVAPGTGTAAEAVAGSTDGRLGAGPSAPPSRRVRGLALAALVVPQAVLVLVQGAAPLLLREAPLVLLALYPYQPWSLLVSSRSGLVAFVAVIVAVRTVPSVGGYLVGRWYGASALDRLSRRRRTVRLTRVFVRVYARVGGGLLILYPGATASVLAGANGMPARRFAPLMLTGLLVGALVTRFLAGAASGPVTAAAGWVDEHAVPLGLALLAAVVVTQLVSRRRAAR